ncbi:hypothetical protein C2S52_001874 [Perilla frutescens var. hirtella]|nr:hypothetical protein C2S52_001874 [Perilla frutescens var. hirtella]
MAVETLLLSVRSSSLLMIAFLVCHQYLFQTSLANNPNSCTSSSCGIIRNISYPFRLKDDPNHCGDRRFELTCESNVTSVSIDSQKYYVKAINYGNSSIRVVDASINNDDTCSFPNYSAYSSTFGGYLYYFGLSLPINLMSCPHPLKNSSLVFTDITHDCASNSSSLSRFTYIKVGNMTASEVPQTCGIDLIVMTSWNKFNDLNSNNSLSLSEIHHSLLYGFELLICTDCRKPSTLWETVVFFFANWWPLLIPLAIVVFLTAGVSLPLMIIIGFTGLLILSFTAIEWINRCWENNFLENFERSWYQRPMPINFSENVVDIAYWWPLLIPLAIVGVSLALMIIIGFTGVLLLSFTNLSSLSQYSSIKDRIMDKLITSELILSLNFWMYNISKALVSQVDKKEIMLD